jgi:hypothetical protein
MVYQSDNSEHLKLQERLRREYVGKTVDEVPTPAFIIDRNIFEDNCGAMIKKANEWGAQFRAHLKTHKVLFLVKRRNPSRFMIGLLEFRHQKERNCSCKPGMAQLKQSWCPRSRKLGRCSFRAW